MCFSLGVLRVLIHLMMVHRKMWDPPQFIRLVAALDIGIAISVFYGWTSWSSVRAPHLLIFLHRHPALMRTRDSHLGLWKLPWYVNSDWICEEALFAQTFADIKSSEIGPTVVLKTTSTVDDTLRMYPLRLL